MSWFGRLRVAATIVVGVLALSTGVAHAHQPVFIDDGTPPEASPLLEDGTVSFAVYGRIDRPGGEASFRVRHGDGQTLTVEVLVPDRPPENGLASFDHLTVVVTDPAGVVTETSGAQVLATFDEPFSKTSYLRVITWSAPAVPGISTITVRSALPTRFTVATGFVERFDGAVSSYTPRPFSELAGWYETPPPEVPATTSTTMATTAPATSTGAAPADVAAPGAAPVPGDAGGTSGSGPVIGVVAVGALVVAAGVALAVRARRPG